MTRNLTLYSMSAALFFSGAAASVAQTTAPTSASMATAKADADMAEVLSTLAGLGGKPIETLEPSEARKQPTPTDAVMKIIKDKKLEANPHAGLKLSNSRLADMGNLRLRWYVPENATKDSNLPVIIYFRGGGWVIADLDVYDSTPSALARKTGAAVVSVDYPLAPENKFPAAHDDAFAAYEWAVKNATSINGDPKRVALAGESAGGGLAVATAVMARDRKSQMPVAVVSVYPIAGTDTTTASYMEHAMAKPLNRAMMSWFFQNYLNGPQDLSNPRVNLIAADLSGLPPTTIINAQIDPLRSDGEMLAQKLTAAGVSATQRTFDGVNHEFFGMAPVVDTALAAQQMAADALNRAFGRR